MRFLSFLAVIGSVSAQFASVQFVHYNDGRCNRVNRTDTRPIGECLREDRQDHFRILTCNQDGSRVKDVEYSDSECSVEVFEFDLETNRCHEGRNSVFISCVRGSDTDAGAIAKWERQQEANRIRHEELPEEVHAFLNASEPAEPGCVDRGTVVSRAAAGAQGQYCECVCPHLSPWRCDCSGLASYAWELAAPGLVTQTLPGVSVRLGSWASMGPGDIILNPSQHVEVFRSWETAGSVFAYCGCHNTADGCSCRTGSTTAYWQANGYYPAKGNNVC